MILKVKYERIISKQIYIDDNKNKPIYKEEFIQTPLKNSFYLDIENLIDEKEIINSINILIDKWNNENTVSKFSYLSKKEVYIENLNPRKYIYCNKKFDKMLISNYNISQRNN